MAIVHPGALVAYGFPAKPHLPEPTCCSRSRSLVRMQHGDNDEMLQAVIPNLGEIDKAMEPLRPHNIGLLDAVRGYLDAHAKREASVP